MRPCFVILSVVGVKKSVTDKGSNFAYSGCRLIHAKCGPDAKSWIDHLSGRWSRLPLLGERLCLSAIPQSRRR